MTRYSRTCLIIALLSLGLLMGGVAGATEIYINNYSFEKPITGSWNVDDIIGWTASGWCGVQLPQNYYSINGVDGKQVAWTHEGGVISQVLSATIQAGMTYTLSALVGTWSNDAGVMYDVQLWGSSKIDPVLLAEATGYPNYGSLVPVSTQYVANNPDYYGDTLEVVLTEPGSGSLYISQNEINFDRVRLNAVPLPPSLLLLGSGLVGLLALRRRQQH
jgi:hypothetical protein